MMHLKLVAVVLVALFFNFFIAGKHFHDKEENKSYEKREPCIDCEVKCVEKYFHCLLSSNRTIQRFIKVDEECCAKTLNDSDDIWFMTFSMCVSALTKREAEKCMYRIGRKCRHEIIRYFTRTVPDFLQFNHDVMARIKPRPSSADECNENFIKEFGNAVKEECKVSTDENVELLCNATALIFN